MKLSQFNSIIPYQGEYLLYNSFSNTFLVLKSLLRDLLQAAKNEPVDELSTVHPDFYNALKQGKFIVEDALNEIEEVKKISKLIDLDESHFHLTINPTMNCNFKCWYCYETHIKKSRMSPDIINRTNAFISRTAENANLKSFNLSWFGGEPLLYYDDIVLPVIKHFSETCERNNLVKYIGFTTNGYLINEHSIKSYKEHSVTVFQITLDGFQADHDKVRYVTNNKGSYTQIIKNIKLLILNEISVRMRINYTLKNIQKCVEIVNDFEDLTKEEKKFVLVDFHRVWQDEGTDNEGLAHMVLMEFKKAGFQVNSHYSPENVTNSCYADKKNSAVINFNGDIFKCTARDFTNVKREGYIDVKGEVIWENDSLNRRLNAKFNNKPCLNCRIMPLCNGGCSQHALDHLGVDEYCVYSFDEKEKDKIVTLKFEEKFLN